MIIKTIHNNNSVSHNYLLFIVLLSFLSIQSFFAQSIQSIEIKGNKEFTLPDYTYWTGLNLPAKNFVGIEDTIKYRIGRGLRSEGYYNYTINRINLQEIDTTNSKIVVELQESSPTRINKTFYNQVVLDSTFLERTFANLQANILRSSSIENISEIILARFEDNGYPFARISIESIFFYTDSIDNNHYADIYFNIDSGRKSVINKIELTGNTKTKDFVIKRALDIEVGDLYSQKKIDNITNRLNRLRFFEPLETPEFYFNSQDEGILKISVKEKETNNFDGIIGYIPGSTQNEKGFLTGFVNINLRNLFGTGRTIAFKWQQESRSSQELEIRYLEPWLLDLPFNIELGLFQRKQDSTYVQRNFESRFDYNATQEVTASLIFSAQSTIPTERVNKIFTVFNSTAYTTGVNLRIDTRDDPYSPTEGIILSNTYKYISKKIDGPKEFITATTPTKVNFQRLEIDFNYYYELFSRQIIAAGVHGRELKGDNVEISDLYLLGGTNTLRGYREKQFAGNRILWSNLEYRYLISNRSFAFLFFDTGYYLRNEDTSKKISKISDFKYGYGLGLNIETALGILGVSFALGKGDSFGDGKIHFGIVNEF